MPEPRLVENRRRCCSGDGGKVKNAGWAPDWVQQTPPHNIRTYIVCVSSYLCTRLPGTYVGVCVRVCIRSVPISRRVDRPVFEDISESENGVGAAANEREEGDRRWTGVAKTRGRKKKTDTVKNTWVRAVEAEEEEGDRFVGISTAFRPSGGPEIRTIPVHARARACIYPSQRINRLVFNVYLFPPSHSQNNGVRTGSGPDAPACLLRNADVIRGAADKTRTKTWPTRTVGPFVYRSKTTAIETTSRVR